MKKITDKQYLEYERYLKDKNNGRILTPDGLRFVCESNGYDPEAIGRHFLEVLPKICPSDREPLPDDEE